MLNAVRFGILVITMFLLNPGVFAQTGYDLERVDYSPWSWNAQGNGGIAIVTGMEMIDVGFLTYSEIGAAIVTRALSGNPEASTSGETLIYSLWRGDLPENPQGFTYTYMRVYSVMTMAMKDTVDNTNASAYGIDYGTYPWGDFESINSGSFGATSENAKTFVPPADTYDPYLGGIIIAEGPSVSLWSRNKGRFATAKGTGNIIQTFDSGMVLATFSVTYTDFYAAFNGGVMGGIALNGAHPMGIQVKANGNDVGVATMMLLEDHAIH
jgi:hypothetical protein